MYLVRLDKQLFGHILRAKMSHSPRKKLPIRYTYAEKYAKITSKVYTSSYQAIIQYGEPSLINKVYMLGL